MLGAESSERHEGVRWRAEWEVQKYDAPSSAVRDGTVKPVEVIRGEGNLLMYGGADVLWLGLKGGLTASTGAGNTYFSNGEASIGVGNSTTAEAATQTNLQAASTANRYRKGMEATYPTHTTGTAASTSSKILFRSLFSTAQAAFAWREWGVFNTTAQTGGRMLNRKVVNLGTKSTSASWQFTVTLSLA